MIKEVVLFLEMIMVFSGAAHTEPAKTQKKREKNIFRLSL